MILLILAVILGLLPVVLISIFIIIRDKEREPVSTLIKYYALGLLAVILTLIISGILNIEQEPSHGALILFMEVLFGIAFIEEGTKWISVKIGMIGDLEFDNMYDAIVFAVAVSLGFAGIENVLYLLTNYKIMFGVAIGRAILSVPGHAIFGVFMGSYLEKAKKCKISGDASGNFTNSVISWVVPSIMHAIFDFLIFNATSDYPLFNNSLLTFAIFFVYVIGLYIFGIRKVIIASKDSNINFYGVQNEEKKAVLQPAPVYNTYTVNQYAPNPYSVRPNFCRYCGTRVTGTYCSGCGAKIQ